MVKRSANLSTVCVTKLEDIAAMIIANVGKGRKEHTAPAGSCFDESANL